VTYPPAPELTACHYPVLLLLQELSEVVIALAEQSWILNTTNNRGCLNEEGDILAESKRKGAGGVYLSSVLQK